MAFLDILAKATNIGTHKKMLIVFWDDSISRILQHPIVYLHIKDSLESDERRGGLPCWRRYAVNRWRCKHWHHLTASRLWAMLNTDNHHRLMVGIGDAAWYHKTDWRLSVFRVALPRKDFSNRSATHRLLAATSRRLCRFARSSRHWHRLRFIGAARFPFCFSMIS